MISDLKYFDGSLSKIDRIPEKVKSKYLSAFEIDTSWFIECASRRQKWIDQAQSLNLYMSGASVKSLMKLINLRGLEDLKPHTIYEHWPLLLLKNQRLSQEA